MHPPDTAKKVAESSRPERPADDSTILPTVACDLPTVAADTPADTRFRVPSGPGIGDCIGPYRLVQKIGEGGMGLVYEAEQLEPIRRRVALKMVRHGMATEQFIARFEAERRALAVMDHPNIARVLDAGATETGQPYFVMEFVAGIPLNRYCDDHALSIDERLRLFVHVCDGVQHAHQKAVIHRDLKPTNVLVTTIDGQPVPKIIDFGVAKILNEDLAGGDATTRAGQMIGTPEYMSPEQVDRDCGAVDTTTDVYALGVMLYELLTGALPFTVAGLKSKGMQEVLHTIKEVEPPRPSARVRTMLTDATDDATDVARRRSAEPPALRRSLRGDLDWITMMALEKEKSRRYATANALGMDIRRHLEFEPVRACPPTRSYRIGKFVRRNRVWVAAGSFVLAAIILGIVGTTAGMIRAVQAERLAHSEAETARQVSDFLVDLFEVADPDQARGNSITAREILDAGSRRIQSDLQDHPLTQARLMHTIGTVYRNLGLYDEASPKLEAALSIQETTPGVDDRVLASSLVDLADLYIIQARYDEAGDLLQRALTMMRAGGPGSDLQLATSLNELASVRRRQGRYDEAAPLYERARDLRIRALGPNDPIVAQSHNSLGILDYQRGRYDQAEKLYRQALDVWRRAYDTDHADIAKALNNLALLYHHQDRFEDARPLYEEAAAMYEKVLGPDHPRLGTAVNNLALVNHEMRNYEAAEPLYRRALAIREAGFGPDHPDVAQTLNNLANLYRDEGQLPLAEPLYERALRIRRDTFGEHHPDVAWSLRDLGVLEGMEGRTDEAAANFDEAIRIYSAALRPDHPDLEEILTDYAEMLRSAGRTARADSLSAAAQEIARMEEASRGG